MLIVAQTAAEWMLLGNDGRLLRVPQRQLGNVQEVADAWSTEFPDASVGRLLLSSAGDGGAAAKRAALCSAAARRISARIEAAWEWDEPAGFAAAGDDAVAELLAEVRQRATDDPSNLLYRAPRDLRSLLATRRARWTLVAVLLVAAAAAGVGLFSERARRSQHSAAQEAAAELEQAAATAGLRRRESAAQTAAIVAEVSSPRPWQRKFLLALSAAVTSADVVDAVELRGPTATIAAHVVDGARRQPAAAAFEPALLAQLSASGIATAKPETGPSSVRLQINPLIAPTVRVDDALSRLPARSAMDDFRRRESAQWMTAVTPQSAVGPIERQQVTFRPKDSGRAAWPNLLSLLAALESEPGATVEFVSARGAPEATGAFSELSVTAMLRTK